jgi:ribosome modulation factor
MIWEDDMSEYTPLSTHAELDLLDMDDCVEGYRAGLNGRTEEPGSDKSKSYWHGWRNAMIDRRLMEPDEAWYSLLREGIAKRHGH